MENESKIGVLLSEMLQKFDVLADTVFKLSDRVDNASGRFDNLSGRFDNLSGRLDNLFDRVDSLTDGVDHLTESVDNLTVTVELRLGRVENEILKLNLVSAENSRALLKMADYNDRLTRLEKGGL